MKKQRAFTLIETLVAISLLVIAVVAPLSLATQSLESAYYARDQITAFYLAQEAIEAVRSVRDGNILTIAENQGGACSPMTLFCGIIPTGETTSGPFRIDASQISSTITPCSEDPGGVCEPLETDGTLYGYGNGWTPTNFTRTVTASYTDASQDEVRVTVTVSWKTGAFNTRSFSISEDMYRWVNDDSG